MRIAIDAMGGDYAPFEVVKGAIEAYSEFGVEIVLVGKQELIEAELKKINFKQKEQISIVNAKEVVAMDESPVVAIRNKKDSSINIGLNLVKQGVADAFVSAGNTGAVMTAAVFTLGRIKDIERPAIAAIWPAKHGNIVLLDVGANVDSKPKHLVQFAHLGSILSEQILNVEKPKVGLINIGEEESKGNELTTDTLALLKNSKLNFIGNVESKDIFNSGVDVFVCDGFVGNVILKFAEGIIGFVYDAMKTELKGSFLAKLGALLLIPAFKSIAKKTNYDEYGGAQLLGVKGVCIIAHGRSKAKAIKNAIRVAKDSIKADIVSKFSQINQNT